MLYSTSDLPIPTLPEKVNMSIPNKNNSNKSDTPNKLNSNNSNTNGNNYSNNTNITRPEKIVAIAESSATALNSSSVVRSREKQEKAPVEVLPIQQFGNTDLKPYKEPYPNPNLQLFQQPTKPTQQQQHTDYQPNPNRYQNLIMNNHHTHMQLPPQLDVQKIPLKVYSSNHESSVDLFDFRTENSIVSSSTKNAQEPKYLLKQSLSERQRMTKNSGNILMKAICFINVYLK